MIATGLWIKSHVQPFHNNCFRFFGFQSNLRLIEKYFSIFDSIVYQTSTSIPHRLIMIETPLLFPVSGIIICLLLLIFHLFIQILFIKKLMLQIILY